MYKKLVIILFTMLVTTVFADTIKARMSVATPDLNLIRQATLIGPVNPDAIISFNVWLKLRNKKQLDQLVFEIYDPNNINYHKFLTSAEFNQRFAPSLNAEKKVQDYFTSQGMSAKIVSHSVHVTATVRQIEKALQIKINQYLYKGRIVFANATPPTLNTDIGQYVLEITDLSNILRPEPLYRTPPVTFNQSTPQQNNKIKFLNIIWNSFVPMALPTTASLAGFTGAHLQHTYNLSNISPINGTSIDGSGQTIVIVDNCGTKSAAQIQTDANLYNSANSLTQFSASNFAVVNSDGTPYTTIGGANCNGGWDTEIALDVQSAHTIAPGANIVLVLASPLNSTALITTLNTILNNTPKYSIGNFNNAYIVSNSWGFIPEFSLPSLETALQSATAQSLSLNFSSGDCGDQTYSSVGGCNLVNVSTPTVSYPASSLYVTTVGGSSLFVDFSWNYAFESGWGTVALSPNSFYSGSGGGISTIYGPAMWQSSISSFTAGGYPNTVGSYNKRALPDIAMLGDPTTGLIIYEGGSTHTIAGTSLACPLFSGTLALVNQARALLNNMQQPIGLAAPYFYQQNSILINAKALNVITPPHQIISGASTIPGGPNSAFQISLIGFNWDSSLTIEENQFWNDVVGVGSPNIPNFVPTMANM